MQISGFKMGGRVNADILRQQGVDLTPNTYFQKAFASWSDNEKKVTASEADISRLKSKYNSPNISDWLSHYTDVLNQVLSNTAPELKQSNVIRSYEDYLNILAKLAVDKRTVTV